MKNLLRYIQGFRKGKEAHQIEFESMKDSFLADSLEGYDAVKGNHVETINEIQRRISVGSRSGHKYIAVWSIAASLLVCISIGGYYWLKKPVLMQYDVSQQIAYSEEKASVDLSDSVQPKQEKEDMLVKVEVVRDGIEHGAVRKMVAAHSSPSVEVVDIVDEMNNVEIVDDSLLLSSVSKSDSSSYKASGLKLDAQIRSPYDLRVASQSKEIRDSLVRIKKMNPSVLVNKIGDFQQCAVPEERLPITDADGTQCGLPKDTISFTLDKQPVPVVGVDAYRNYLEKNIVYPEDSVCGEIKGLVVVEFSTDKDGFPVNIVVKKQLCDWADKEAVRLVKYGPKWTVSNIKTQVTVKF